MTCQRIRLGVLCAHWVPAPVDVAAKKATVSCLDHVMQSHSASCSDFLISEVTFKRVYDNVLYGVGVTPSWEGRAGITSVNCCFCWADTF